MRRYDFKKIEKKWQSRWAKMKLYRASDVSKKKKYYSLIEFPFLSGEGLHVGHIRSYTALDVIARKRRMEGYNVLYPIGYDAFGLPAENYAIKTGIHPSVITKKNAGTFRRQLKSLGFSFDWSREINTSEPDYFKWTQWIFLQFLKHGLAYKKKMPINWCPKDKIGLANEEVVTRSTSSGQVAVCERCGTPTEKREKEQWMLAITKYADRLDKDLDTVDYLEKIKIQQRNWIGRSEGAVINFYRAGSLPEKILIATRNKAKIFMVKSVFPKLPGVKFITLDDLAPIDDSSLVEGDDYEENARRKSEFYFKKTGIPSISTDHIIWLEKWPEDDGFIVHCRKLANPKSPRATDEEVARWIEKFVDKYGESKANFHYAVSFTDKDGSHGFTTKQRDYILQKERSPKHLDGYIFDTFMKDPETGEFRVEQKPEVGFGHFKNSCRAFVEKVFKPVTVFTTRPDTLFGATYVVVAPDHPFVNENRHRIANWDEVNRYCEAAKKKTDIERTAIAREKTGVALQGLYVINPGNGETLPVWSADYVLSEYGSGAIMAVPAHDERDFAFARAYELPIREVIEPVFEKTTGQDAARPGESYIKRRAVVAIVRHWSEKKYLCLKWKTSDWRGFIVGGIEKNEDPVAAGLREIAEETGYTRAQFVEKIGRTIHSKFYQTLKKENRLAHFECLYFELEGPEQKPIADRERAIHDVEWLSAKEVGEFLNVEDMRFFWRRFQEPENTVYTGEGLLANSGEFDGVSSAEAKGKITEAVGGEVVVNYKLRDWVFSRQRYWGEPIPVVQCEKCGIVPVPEKDLPVKLPGVKNYKPTDTGESPLASVSKWVNVKCPNCKGRARRETDTMPNWAGSSWYYLAYVIHKNLKSQTPISKQFPSTKIQSGLNYWSGISTLNPPLSTINPGPVDWYNGGMEHTTLHLLYSRFWHKFLFDLKLVPTMEPYAKRTSHGLILAEGGGKMSKSKPESIVNPDTLVERFGADSLRLYELFIGPFEQSVSWSKDGLVGTTRFLERVWRISLKIKDIKPASNNLQLITLLHQTVKKVGEDIEAMRFNTAVSQLMIFLNELEKSERIERQVGATFLKLLGPFAPHIAQELWQEIGEMGFIDNAPWPTFDLSKLRSETSTIVVQVNGRVRGSLSAQKGDSEEFLKQTALALPDVMKWLSGHTVKKVIYVRGRIINFVLEP